MEQYLTGGGIGATIIGVLFTLFRLFNHKRIRSKCCGKIREASLDIDDTRTPAPHPTTPPNLVIKTPVEEFKKSTTSSFGNRNSPMVHPINNNFTISNDSRVSTVEI